MSDENWLGWISVRDPAGMVHMLGDVEDAQDWTECRREFSTVDGWHGLHPDTAIDTVCAKCVEVVIAAYQKRAGVFTLNSGTSISTITIENCSVGPAADEENNG